MYNYCDKRFLFLFPYLYSILMTQVFLPALIVVQFATLGELIGLSEKLLVAFLIFVSRIGNLMVKISWSFPSSSFFYHILIKIKK